MRESVERCAVAAHFLLCAFITLQIVLVHGFVTHSITARLRHWLSIAGSLLLTSPKRLICYPTCGLHVLASKPVPLLHLRYPLAWHPHGIPLHRPRSVLLTGHPELASELLQLQATLYCLKRHAWGWQIVGRRTYGSDDQRRCVMVGA